MGKDKTSGSVARVQEALRALGLDDSITTFGKSTRTAEKAAAAIGCTVAQICKSMVFRGTESGRAILILASGVNRVSETRAAEAVGENLERPDAAFVRQETGFAIGGVAPVGHLKPLPLFIDEDLLQYEVIWAAAGAPTAVFSVDPRVLSEKVGGVIAGIT